jgi:26S proteasome regulatory subunit N1
MAQDTDAPKAGDKGKGKAADDSKDEKPVLNGKKEDDKKDGEYRPALVDRTIQC